MEGTLPRGVCEAEIQPRQSLNHLNTTICSVKTGQTAMKTTYKDVVDSTKVWLSLGISLDKPCNGIALWLCIQ